MSHVLRVGVADQIAYFRAYNTDGSAKTDLTSATTGLTLSVFRVGASSVSIASLSNKAADDTAHADGAIRAVGGNLYTIDIPDAATATQVPSVVVRGSYTGGVVEGLEHPIVAYNPAVVAVGANTTTPPTASAIADAVYDEAYAGHTTPGTYGFLWDQWRKSNPAITGEVTSAVTPTTTTFSTDITGYDNGAFENAVLIFINGSTNADFRGVVSGYLQSNGVVTITPALPQAPVAGDEFTIAIPSFVYTLAQVQSGLATSNGVTAAFTEIKGAGWSSATDTLEEIADAAGGGGGSTVIVSPLQAVAPDRVSGTEVMTFINDVSAIGPIAVTDADGVAVDLSALTLKVCIEKIDGTILANVTPSISGVDNNQITFTPNADSVAKTGTFRWSLRRTSNNQVYAYGDFVVDAAARIS
jgi:hypothetical protein